MTVFHSIFLQRIGGIFLLEPVFTCPSHSVNPHSCSNKYLHEVIRSVQQRLIQESESREEVPSGTRRLPFSLRSFGYIKDPKNKNRLLIDLEAAEIVRDMFHMIADGYSVTQIASLTDVVYTPAISLRYSSMSSRSRAAVRDIMRPAPCGAK